jgi:D-arabinose 1-dehydrogenase-like Zn-dependent alcohol dehydrogenase
VRCKSGNEHFCDNMVGTYGGIEKDGKTPTYGGYSTRVTVDEHYVLVSDIEMIPIAKVNEAYERILRSDVRYRFVIDMTSLR